MEPRKFFTVSYDDGVLQDRKLVNLLKEYGLKGTFNISAGMFGFSQRLIHAGETIVGQVRHRYSPRLWFFPSVEQKRLPEKEVRALYSGFEIATHALHHEHLPFIDRDTLSFCLAEDVKRLSEIAGYPVTGHAYPYGMFNKAVKEAVRQSGISYARTTVSTGRFDVPSDVYEFNPTCRHSDVRVFELIDDFLAAEPDHDMIFCLWGHAYEFDFSSDLSSWDRIRRIFDCIAGRSDITYCTNMEALTAARAVK